MEEGGCSRGDGERAGGGRAHGKPAGRGERGAAARKQAWKSCRFSAAAAAEGEGRNRVQRRESPLFTFQLLLGEAAGELTAASAAAARGRQIHVLDGYACRRWRQRQCTR